MANMNGKLPDRMKVLYLINYAPNYREPLLRELGKRVNLTVASYRGDSAGLADPEERVGYRFVELKRYRVAGVNFNLREFFMGFNYDLIIVGYTLWHPLRMANLFRFKPVVAEGLIYGRSNSWITGCLRRLFLTVADNILVYSKLVERRLRNEIKNKEIISFNNTSYALSELKQLPITFRDNRLNILWIGSMKKRKKVHLLVELARRNKSVNIRLIGPGMTNESFTDVPENLDLLGPLFGDCLEEHFLWSHVVFNPGNIGLLVMNAARYSRCLVIDDNSQHGPEVQLAYDADQIFIDFEDSNMVDSMVSRLLKNSVLLRSKGIDAFNEMKNYTLEFMVEKYIEAIMLSWRNR